MRKTLFVLAGAAALALPVAPAAASTEDKDCADFATTEEAQAALAGGDPFGLDADDDGVACEGGVGGPGEEPAPPVEEPGEEQEPAVGEGPETLPRTGPEEDLALVGGGILAGGVGLVVLSRLRRTGRV